MLPRSAKCSSNDGQLYNSNQNQRSRIALATIAFPGLVKPVRDLRAFLYALVVFLTFAWLPFTAVTYWDVGFGRSVLQVIDQAEKERVTLMAGSSPEALDANCKANGSLCARRREKSDRQEHALEDLKTILLGTGDAVLVEHTEKDSYWGDGGDGSGKNRLGHLLTALREELWAESKQPPAKADD